MTTYPVIKLGAPGDLHDYSLEAQGNGIAWQRNYANPFAVQVNTTNKYNKVEIFNPWIQETWDQGVGKTDPEAGGSLYSEVETRIPNQLVLSPLVRMVDAFFTTQTTQDCRYMPDDLTGEITVGGTGNTIQRVAMKMFFNTGTLPDQMTCWFYAQISPDVPCTFAIYTDSSGPSTLKVSGSYTAPEDTPGWYWHGLNLATSSLSDSTNYWLVLYPTTSTDVIKVGYGTAGYETVAKSYNGTAWANISSKYILYSTNHNWFVNTWAGVVTPTGAAFFRFEGDLYLISQAQVYRYDTASDYWAFVDHLNDGVSLILYSTTGVATWGDKVYIGNGGLTTTKGMYMDTSEHFHDTTTDAFLYAKYGRYLYRAYQNDLYYSGDGSTWTGPFPIGSDEFTITGMAGMGDSLYVATAEALYRFAPGDIVDGVSTWGSLDETNGTNMISHAGSIYVTINGRVANITQDGRIMDIWINRDDDVIRGRIGKVWGLTSMNNWLVALVGGVTDGDKPTLWAFQDTGWHHLATLPTSNGNALAPYADFCCYYDRETQSLWAITPESITFRLYVPDYALNPYNDGNATFVPRGWIEQSRFFGGEYFLTKYFDGVTVAGDNISANQSVTFYYQDSNSSSWTLLGTITEDGGQLRWADIDVAETVKWIRLGWLLSTNDADETPRLRAVVVKFLPRTTNRILDNVTINSSNYTEMPNGAPDTQTAAQAFAHLTGTDVIGASRTVIYQDPLGVQYEVVIKNPTILSTKFANYNNANQIGEYRVNLTLEQVTETPYVP